MITGKEINRRFIIPPYIIDKLQSNEADRGSIITFRSDIDRKVRKRREMIGLLSQNKKTMLFRSGRISAISTPKMKMAIHDARQLPILPGRQIWNTGRPTKFSDADVKNVYGAAKATWDFFYTIFKRNSLDNKGMLLIQSVHFREDPRIPFCNAFWDGTQMIFGDGDGKYFDSFTTDIDIVAHELTHGIIDFESDLVYRDQSGALNESFADVFGIMVKQWANRTRARKSDWLIGKNILIGKRYSLRSMKAPGTAYINHPDIGTDPQPGVYKDFIKTKMDDGGVHLNSGIPNYAFFITAFELSGFSWEKAGQIWYAALTDRRTLKKNSDFNDAKNATILKAEELFGKGSLEKNAVEKGWKEAGL